MTFLGSSGRHRFGVKIIHVNTTKQTQFRNSKKKTIKFYFLKEMRRTKSKIKIFLKLKQKHKYEKN